jgi:hypothetical protein
MKTKAIYCHSWQNEQGAAAQRHELHETVTPSEMLG